MNLESISKMLDEYRQLDVIALVMCFIAVVCFMIDKAAYGLLFLTIFILRIYLDLKKEITYQEDQYY